MDQPVVAEHVRMQEVGSLMCSGSPDSQPLNDSAPRPLQYKEAASRYRGLDFRSPKAVSVVREGIEAWARSIEQWASASADQAAAANMCGLRIETSIIQVIRGQLVAAGQTTLAECLWTVMLQLLDTAETLDTRYLAKPFESKIDTDLLEAAQAHATAVADILATIQGNASVPSSCPPPGRKRGAPRRRDPADDQKLVEAWEATRDKAGMTRKQFCATHKISLRNFVRAQDRLRKQRSH